MSITIMCCVCVSECILDVDSSFVSFLSLSLTLARESTLFAIDIFWRKYIIFVLDCKWTSSICYSTIESATEDSNKQQ